MKFEAFYCIILLAVSSFSSGQNQHNSLPAESNFILKGRTEKISENKITLISPASSVTFTFNGMEANYTLQSIDTWEHHNYFCMEVDGEYKGRFKIEKGEAQFFSVKSTENKDHVVTIYKATEAASGTILFDGSSIKNIIPTTLRTKRKIELIGDSITCGHKVILP